ncbi:putative glycolipid-binding domain-containing protein [Limimaricola variabilis]|uniref:putative glycolipid-binding domain-containing protein n=1 Tax=Limimaricola variabilis TaxID=1492771 RepID=UPI002AC97A90|nr:putative glycolipid-binding domain-containing protein [Limimaricola variabilis]WPY93776.1 putative glycolipid-binding domain-containing protein [Limimaricola variabilis]
MTGTTVASVIWHRLDRDGTDRCRLARLDEGWLIMGHARWDEAGEEVALDYALRCDSDWRCLGADVTGLRGQAPVAYRISREGAGFALEGQAPVQGEDLDLGFTPAWMVVPLNRLTLPDARPRILETARLRASDGGRLEPLGHSFARLRGGLDHAIPALGRDARLSLHECGFVTADPGLWQGAVTTEGRAE